MCRCDPRQADALEAAEVANMILRCRERAGLSQAVLAAKIGTKAPAISRLESTGYGKPSLTTLRKIAAAFGMRVQVTFVPLECECNVQV